MMLHSAFDFRAFERERVRWLKKDSKGRKRKSNYVQVYKSK